MQITTSLPTGQLKRFNIRICAGRETAIQTTIARSQAQAWNVAFDLCERLLGDKPPRSISVKPVPVRSGLYVPAGEALQPRAVGSPMARAGRGHTPIVVEVDAALGVAHLPVKTDRLDLLGRQRPCEFNAPVAAHQGLVAAV